MAHIKHTIEEMNAIALAKGGVCLSETYSNSTTKLLWQCKFSHRWEATPTKIINGSWCPVCANVLRLTIEDMRSIANSRDGKCISAVFVNARSKMSWECAQGHTWAATPMDVKRGHWCPICAISKKGASQRLTIEEMKALAESRGGKCLSDSYVNARSHLLWQCENNHVWRAVAFSVIRGHWCPKCAHKQRLTIEEMQQVAMSRGGKCLSDKYINEHTPLLWQCAEGHRWQATPEKIKHAGRWCPICSTRIGERTCREFFEQLFGHKFPRRSPKWLLSSKGRPMELDGFCKELNLAFEHQGEQHYSTRTHYVKSRKKLFERKLHDQLKRHLCIQNGITLIEIPEIGSRLPVENVKGYIKNECISKGCSLPEDFEDKEIDLSHAYSSSYATMLYKELCDIAEKKGGKLLSAQYERNNYNMHWECEKGHKWHATPNNIKNGKWCPVCGGSSLLSLEEMQSMATQRGGLCLSNEYINNRDKMLWRCAESHEWEAPATVIKYNNSWCPVCAIKRRGLKRRLDSSEMHEIAAQRGGKCLSTDYLNARSKLTWECDKGHIWQNSISHIKNGQWCPVCSRLKRRKPNLIKGNT